METKVVIQQKVQLSQKITFALNIATVSLAGLGMLIFAYINTPTVAKATHLPSDTTPPFVEIISPINQSTISGDTQLQIYNEDRRGVARMDLYLDGALRFSETDPANNWIFPLDTTQVENGDHALLFEATDSSGLTANTLPLIITVNN
ncbi:MAG: Ig-like domain-containing protein [Patescibacteria group bacterium]|jgi:hypothetical protein